MWLACISFPGKSSEGIDIHCFVSYFACTYTFSATLTTVYCTRNCNSRYLFCLKILLVVLKLKPLKFSVISFYRIFIVRYNQNKNAAFLKETFLYFKFQFFILYVFSTKILRFTSRDVQNFTQDLAVSENRFEIIMYRKYLENQLKLTTNSLLAKFRVWCGSPCVSPRITRIQNHANMFFSVQICLHSLYSNCW